MALQRLVISFERDGIQVRTLYRSSPSEAGPNPGTVARRREVVQLARTGLERALEALDGSARVDVIGTSGFETREDVIAIERKDVA